MHITEIITVFLTGCFKARTVKRVYDNAINAANKTEAERILQDYGIHKTEVLIDFKSVGRIFTFSEIRRDTSTVNARRYTTNYMRVIAHVMHCQNRRKHVSASRKCCWKKDNQVNGMKYQDGGRGEERTCDLR